MNIHFHDRARDIGLEEKSFDIFFCALGYESRCTHIPLQLAARLGAGFCYKFKDRNELSFARNQRIFHDLRFTVATWEGGRPPVSELHDYIARQIGDRRGDAPASMGIDVSSMTRQMAAHILYAVLHAPSLQARETDLTVLYAPAVYVEPEAILVPVMTAGPVIPEYAGWAIYPERPAVAVIGMGYEYGRAIGVLDYLDVSDTWLFSPVGEDVRFDAKVEEINANLIALVGQKKLIEYMVYDPYDTVIKLRSLLEGLQHLSRVVLVPFGPKMFNAICLIIAEMFGPSISVWRVSGGVGEAPIDRRAGGDIVHLTFTCEPTESDGGQSASSG